MRAAQRLGFLRKACRVIDISGRLTAYKGFVRPLMEYSPLAWGGAAPHHLSQLDKTQRRALALIGPGVFVESLALRRTISGICFIYKLMCGPRVHCLQTLLPPRSTLDPLPRTRQQVRIANGHSLQLSSTLPPRSQNAVRRSFPYLYIPIWNSLPQMFCECRAWSSFSASHLKPTSTYLKTTGPGQPKLTLSTPPNYELLIYTTSFCFLSFPPSPLHCP